MTVNGDGLCTVVYELFVCGISGVEDKIEPLILSATVLSAIILRLQRNAHSLRGEGHISALVYSNKSCAK